MDPKSSRNADPGYRGKDVKKQQKDLISCVVSCYVSNIINADLGK